MRVIPFDLILVAAMLCLTSCREPPSGSDLVPSMEQTGFEYLSSTGEQIRKQLATARIQSARGNQLEAMANVDNAEALLKVLLYYEVPVTEARQFVYDAGRWHAMNRSSQASALLARADRALNKIASHGDAMVQRAVQDPILKIRGLQLLIREAGAQTSSREKEKMSVDIAGRLAELGHSLNMMALKGDIVLAGAHFHD